MRRITAWVAALAAPGLIVAGCSSSGGESTADTTSGSDPKRGGVLRIGIGADIGDLDPGSNAGVTYQSLKMQGLYNTLYTFDKDLQKKPDLAESWEQVDDTTYRFKIRDGVTFHTGRPMTASDVEFSFEWMLNEKKKYARELSHVVGADQAKPGADIPGITAVDDTTLEIKLDGAWSPFLGGLYTIPIIDKETVNEITTKPIGTGPFKFVERVENDRVVLERYDNYWEKGKPYLDRMEFRVLPDASAAYSSMKGNELDAILSVEPGDAKNLIGDDPDVKVLEVPSTDLVMLHLGIDKGQPALKDVHARRALAYCLDKDAVNKLVYFGYGKQQWSPIPSPIDGYDESVESLGYPYSVEKARAELAKSGTPSGFSMTYTALSGLKSSEDTGTIWKECLDQIGIDLKIETLEFGAWLEKFDAYDYDALFNFGALPPYPYRGFEIFFDGVHGDPGTTQWKNDEIWDLMRQAAVGTESEQDAAYKALQKVTVEEAAPTIYVQQNPTLTAYSTKVVGYDSYNAMHMVDWASIWIK